MGGVQLGDRREKGIQVHVRQARVEDAAEALDEAKQLDATLVGPHAGPQDRRVQGRRIATRGENADAFHEGPQPRRASQRRLDVEGRPGHVALTPRRSPDYKGRTLTSLKCTTSPGS